MKRPAHAARARGCLAAVALAASLSQAGCDDLGRVTRSVANLFKSNGARELRPGSARRATNRHPGLLVLALDGVPRAVLYDLLRRGELPGFARLLGGLGDSGALPHAHLDDTLTATLPSSTLAAWATTFTGVTPARHGASGNEFFIRESLRFVAPVPVSVESDAHALETQSDSLLDRVISAPTVYQRLREHERGAAVWVALSQVHEGADRFLLPDRSVLVGALMAHIGDSTGASEGYAAYAQIDQSVIENVTDEVAAHGAPDVLTLYLVGADLYAHEAETGPRPAIERYLREVLDGRVGAFADRLSRAGHLDHRYVVVVADHGHTAVIGDDTHSLGTDGDDEPPAVLRAAGFTLRPFELTVDQGARFDAVLAYQGAMAFVYLADRSRCPASRPCDWGAPPRYREDVLAAAEAFHRANEGEGTPALRGALDMILVREPVAQREVDRPFEVYLGGGRTTSVEDFLREHPRTTYVDLAPRLRDLAVGPLGERAGDVLLLAHNGDRERPEERYYFAHEYRSWHGSPSRADSDLPLVVAHRGRSSSELAAITRRALGGAPHPTQDKVTDLMLALRREPR